MQDKKRGDKQNRRDKINKAERSEEIDETDPDLVQYFRKNSEWDLIKLLFKKIRGILKKAGDDI